MKPTISISAVKSEVNLPKRRVEAVVNCSKSKCTNFQNKPVLTGYENVSWRFLNALANGNVHITFFNRQKNKYCYKEIPTTASFLAACTKGGSGGFKFQCGISLS